MTIDLDKDQLKLIDKALGEMHSRAKAGSDEQSQIEYTRRDIDMVLEPNEPEE